MTQGDSARMSGPLIGLMVGMTVVKAGNVVAAKMVVNDVDPYSAMFYRSLGAVLVVLLIGAALRRAPVAPWRFGWLGWCAAALFGTNVTLFYVGTALTEASRVAIIINLQPVVVACVAPALFPAETLTVRKTVGLALAFGGVACIIGLDAWSGRGVHMGDLIVFGAMLFWALGTVLEKRVLAGLPADRGPISVVLWNLSTLPCALVVGMMFTNWRPATEMGAQAIYANLYLITLGTGMFLGMRWVLQRAPVSLVTSFNFLLPVWGVLFSVVILGDTLSPDLAVGMALVALGIFVVNRPVRPAAPMPVPLPAPAE